MKLFIDSADLGEIEKAARTGLVDGVTTNPSLVAAQATKAIGFKDLMVRICELVNGPVSAEVTATDAAGMVAQGKELAGLHKNIVVKVPLTWDGLRATRQFTDAGIRTNVTLCFSPLQAMMAAKAGATYVSPFVGRLDDIGQDGMQLITDIKKIYANYGYKTQVLVASVRHLEHMLRAAQVGGDVATIPFKVFDQLLNHPLTDSGLAKFLKDWENAKK